jgi:hypothetical protein
MRENFEKLAKRKDWVDPDSPTSPKKFTVHRQKQLEKILKSYGRQKIPFTHFSSEIIKNHAKRNKYAFPVVFAFICGILKIEGTGLIKPKELVLGEWIGMDRGSGQANHLITNDI